MARILTVGLVVLIVCGVTAAQQPPAGGSRDAAQSGTSRTVQAELRFDRNDLSRALESVSEQIGVPIEIVKEDLQLNGITNCQSIGFNEPKQAVEELLKKLLKSANRDDKLAYTVRRNAFGVETVYVCVRGEAEKRGDELFPEFKIGGPQKPIALAPPHGWSSLIRASTLEEEIRRQLGVLEKLAEADAPEAQVRTAIAQLATLFNIVDQYDGEIRWKNEARTVCIELTSGLPPPGTWGDAERQRVTSLSKRIDRLVYAATWVHLPATMMPAWPKVTTRAAVMRRFETGLDALEKWDDTPEGLAKARDAVVREAELTAALAHVIRDTGYTLSDDPLFDGHARVLQARAQGIFAVAHTSDDPAVVRREIKALRSDCDSCHGSFR